MKTLTFESDEPIEAEERGDWREHGEKLMKLLEDNLKDRPQLFDFFNEVILDSDFLDCPFGGKGRGKMLGGLTVRTLSVIDHALALNEAWGMSLRPEEVLVCCVLRALPYGGSFKTRGKYLKKINATVRARSFSWIKNTSFDKEESFALLLENLIKANGVRSHEILTILPHHKGALSFLISTCEEYVDKHTEI